ncbi:MAG: hypothetical protein QMD13_09400 [Candidatus Bathyarchaeia archaeon]|nr:hypothetical protein [Candidatus Bathyarchaeia archaeon]
MSTDNFIKAKKVMLEFSPCGHHVSKLKLIAKTKTDSTHPKSLDVLRCECGKVYMKVAGMPFETDQRTLEKLAQDGLLEWIHF